VAAAAAAAPLSSSPTPPHVISSCRHSVPRPPLGTSQAATTVAVCLLLISTSKACLATYQRYSFSVFYLRAIYKMADGAEGRGRGGTSAPSLHACLHLHHHVSSLFRSQVVVVLEAVSLAAVIAVTAAVVDVVRISQPRPSLPSPLLLSSPHPSSGGRGRGGPRRGGDADKDAWNPITKLGRLVKARKIDSLEHIFLYSMPIKEYQIIDHFFPKASSVSLLFCPCFVQSRPRNTCSSRMPSRMRCFRSPLSRSRPVQASARASRSTSE
jgi:hypothetical protein